MTDETPAERWRLVRGTNLKSEDRHVLLTLFLFQGNNRSAFCKQETIAEEIGVHPRSIRRSLQRLNAAGILKSQWRIVNGVPLRTYAIQFDALKAVQRSDGRTPASYPEPDDGRTPASWSVGHQCPGHQDTSVLQEDPINIHLKSNKGNSGNSRSPSGKKSGRKAGAPSSSFTSEDEATARWMFEIVRKLQPNHKQPNFETWAKDIRLMRERDGRTDIEIRGMFQAADNDTFWRLNIRCPAKLREKWDNLERQFLHGKKNGQKAASSSKAAAAWQNLKKAIRHVDRGQPYKEKLRSKLGEQIFQAAEQVGFSDLFSITEFNESKLFSTFTGAFEQVTTVSGET